MIVPQLLLVFVLFGVAAASSNRHQETKTHHVILEQNDASKYDEVSSDVDRLASPDGKVGDIEATDEGGQGSTDTNGYGADQLDNIDASGSKEFSRDVYQDEDDAEYFESSVGDADKISEKVADGEDSYGENGKTTQDIPSTENAKASTPPHSSINIPEEGVDIIATIGNEEVVTEDEGVGSPTNKDEVLAETKSQGPDTINAAASQGSDGAPPAGGEVSPKVESKSNESTVETVQPYGERKVPLREILLRLKLGNTTTTAGSVEHRSMSPLQQSTPSTNKTTPSRRAVCIPTPTEDGIQPLNSTGLMSLVSPNPNVSSRAIPSPCVLVLFYSVHCRFSVAAAPHVRAAARFLAGRVPVYGVDSSKEHSINAQYGVMGTPTFVLFHNGHNVATYNRSSFNGLFIKSFLMHWTDYTDTEDIMFDVGEEDIEGPLIPRTPVPSGGWFLMAAWVFLAGAGGHAFGRSATCAWIVEAVLNSWREAEAHQHQD